MPKKELKLKEYPTGRKCEKCKKVLSIYNPGPSCYIHGECSADLSQSPAIGAGSNLDRYFLRTLTEYEGGKYA